MERKGDWTATAEGDVAIYEHVSGWEIWWRWSTTNTLAYIVIGPGELSKPIDVIGKRFPTLKQAIAYAEAQAAKASNQPPTTQAKE